MTAPDRADETGRVSPGDQSISALCIDTIRTLAMDAVQQAESGHPGAPMALAPVVYTLWQHFLRFDPAAPDWPNRDRFVLSNGHASMLLYAMLHPTGVKEASGEPAVTLGDSQVADRLRGNAAIANAKLAYVRYKALFSGRRWQRLAASNAKTQRLLWASTGTKNPAYKDTMYVEALVGQDTVNTIPPATMDAFRNHGKAIPDAIEQEVAGARATIDELERLGISLEDAAKELVADGVQQFADAFDKLLGSIAAFK